MVEYVSGASKKTRSGQTNELRRISRDDVDRLSRGQPSKRKGYGSRGVPHRLNESERAEMDRAAKKGFLVVDGSGIRRARKGSPLVNIHRQWCDARAKPQIVVSKAAAVHDGDVVDQVICDLSPLRLNGLFDDPDLVAGYLVKWKTDIFTAASNAGLVLQEDDDGYDDEEEDHGEGSPDFAAGDFDDNVITFDSQQLQEAWATQPIWKLPVVSVGVFEGHRSKAKTMAKELAILWEVPEETKGSADGPKSRRKAGAKKGGRTKPKGLSEHRRRTRGGGHRQEYTW